MKKLTAMAIALCMLISSIPLSACATTVDMSEREILANIVKEAYAVVLDENGNVIETLDVDLTLSEVSNQRNAGTTYTLTARATKTNSDSSGPEDGVTAEGTITWNDIFGPTNLLVSVSGHWIVGDETISDPIVTYGAQDAEFNNIGSPFVKYPALDEDHDFLYEPSNCTGHLFYLDTIATVDATDHPIKLHVETSVWT